MLYLFKKEKTFAVNAATAMIYVTRITAEKTVQLL
jgi:hypothetical protein